MDLQIDYVGRHGIKQINLNIALNSGTLNITFILYVYLICR
jgi:hypothetical protein